jgi:predicted exporter
MIRNDMTSCGDGLISGRWPFRLFLLALIALVALAGWQWRSGAPVSSDLLALLPHGSTTPLHAKAEARMQAPVNRDLIVLISHPDAAQAKALAAQIGTQWQATPLFANVQWSLDTDLQAVRQQLIDHRLSLLSTADRALIADDPAHYIQERVQALLDPVGVSIVPPDQDWFGLAARAQRALPHPGNVSADLDGSLIAEHAGQTWAVLRAQTQGDAFDGDLPAEVAARVALARTTVNEQGGRVVAASGLLYAAHGAEQARREMSLIGGLSGGATVLLLLLVFRRARVLLAAIPVVIGMLAGITTCVAIYGSIHVLTLVLGASLIGVAVDYPLHVLSKSWALQPWRVGHALRLTWPGLTLGLATNVVGYLALAFTPLPALTQVAAFSSAGLLGAYLATLFLLPRLMGNAPLSPWPTPLYWAQQLLNWHARLINRVGTPALLAMVLCFCVLGAWRLDLRDDLRQWVSRAPMLQDEAMEVGLVTGFQPTSQFLLVSAPDEPQLFERLGRMRPRLEALLDQRSISRYLSLDQIVAPVREQAVLRDQLPALLSVAGPLLALGIEPDALQAEVDTLRSLPDVTIERALSGAIGEPWRPLWLGEDADGVAAIVSVQGLADASSLEQVAKGIEGVEVVDRIAELNGVFSDTRHNAALLKLVACLLIFIVLCLSFGARGAGRIVTVSLLSAACSLACLGWMGLPLTLFGLFGLLLVTAIGVDYAILLRERVGGLPVSLLGTLLSAVTTWLSFGLLALSATPAVSSFGVAVTLGLIFNFLLAPWAAERRDETKHA